MQHVEQIKKRLCVMVFVSSPLCDAERFRYGEEYVNQKSEDNRHYFDNAAELDDGRTGGKVTGAGIGAEL